MSAQEEPSGWHRPRTTSELPSSARGPYWCTRWPPERTSLRTSNAQKLAMEGIGDEVLPTFISLGATIASSACSPAHNYSRDEQRAGAQKRRVHRAVKRMCHELMCGYPGLSPQLASHLFRGRSPGVSKGALLVAKEVSAQSRIKLTFLLCAGHMPAFMCSFYAFPKTMLLAITGKCSMFYVCWHSRGCLDHA